MTNGFSDQLKRAFERDDVEFVRKWILDGNSINDVISGFSSSPLTCAVVWKAVKTTRTLLELGADVEQRNQFGDTSLIIAASIGWLDGVKLLLQAGADVNARDKDGCTPLMEAVRDRTKERLEIVKLLIKAGADVNAKMFNGAATVLSRSLRAGSPAITKELIASGAKVDEYILRDGCALHRAIEYNRPDQVEVLLQGGADQSIRRDINIDDKFGGMTGLEVAKLMKLKKIVALLEGGGKVAASKGAVIPSVSESWKAIKAALKEQDRLDDINLKRAATAASLGKFAAKWNVTLPDEFIESYRIHNGQESGGSDLIPSPTRVEGGDTFQLLPLDEIDSEWVSWNDVTATGQFQDTPSSPDKGIRDDWWNAGWIPFASNGGGDSICLDLNPAKGGKAGQVITMNHETSERRLLADSFAEWLADLAESLGESN